MNYEELNKSLSEYNEQLNMIKEALKTTETEEERKSLISLQNDLNELVQLTRESLETLSKTRQPVQEEEPVQATAADSNTNELDDEYALFMKEMAGTGAYDKNDANGATSSKATEENSSDSDIEDELATLLGMKCAVYHTHRWGGQPTLHNAMVCSVVPRQDDDQFKDLQVRVLFTHPTHAEMLPCPYYLSGDCKFDDEQCRYSHGAIVQLSSLKEAIEPNFEVIRAGSRVLLKLKPPDDEDITQTKKSTEKYHLWHRAVVKGVEPEKRSCVVKYEHGVKSGGKRKSNDEIHISFADIFPLNSEEADDSDSDSLSDTEYPDAKSSRSTAQPEPGCSTHRGLLAESMQSSGPALGEWERHTRGMGSKLMLAMGYVPGAGLGAAGAGRVAPVEARRLPLGRSLDHCMEISERNGAVDPLKVEQKLKRMQKKEEERNKRAYEREKERERRNVFNFLNKTLGDKGSDETEAPPTDIKQSTSKDLNIEQFKIMEETKKLEKEIIKLNTSLSRNSAGSAAHKGISLQLSEKNKELNILRNKEQQIAKEQRQRKDKQKMTVF